jgi:hypothetical protein
MCFERNIGINSQSAIIIEIMSKRVLVETGIEVGCDLNAL